ncbi:hypothetical protein BGZ81_006348 [Podila clonocystis]|nr:hypothetical protein BGZ81_006348 [Podila clonocystis]
MTEKDLLSIEQVDEALSREDADFLLCHLSSQGLLQHEDSLGALLVRTDILNQLADIDSLHAQYVIYRLLKAVLLLGTQYRRNANIAHKDAFLRALFTKLITPECSILVKRAILELYHVLLKDHRQLLEDIEGDNWLDHPAGIIFQHLSSPDVWILMPNLLKEPLLQHAALVLLIDIEKARTRLDIRTVPGMTRSVHVCHEAILGCMPQLLCINQFAPTVLAKLLESIGITISPTNNVSITAPSETITTLAPNNNTSNIKVPLLVLFRLGSFAKEAVVTLHGRDPTMEHSFQAWTNTNFIQSEHFGDNAQSSVATVLSSTRNICQLGKVLLTSILAIQDVAIDEFSKESFSSHGPSSSFEMYDQLAEAIPALDIFLHAWVGPQTLQFIFRICGEDDTNVAWFLKTSAVIQQQLETWMVLFERTTSQALSPSPMHSLSVLGNFVHKIYTHLHHYVHPAEALFTFLGSIGYDPQTLLDLLMTLDGHSGGMLGAMMAILRKLTEDPVDQQRLTTRWQEALEQGHYNEDDHDDDEEDEEEEGGYLLSHVEACLDQLASQIRALDQKGLFPYNPKPLLLVLHRTQELLAKELNDSCV